MGTADREEGGKPGEKNLELKGKDTFQEEEGDRSGGGDRAWLRAREQEGCRRWKALEPVGRREGSSSRQQLPGHPRQEGTRNGDGGPPPRVKGACGRGSKGKPLLRSPPGLPRFEGRDVCREKQQGDRVMARGLL